METLFDRTFEIPKEVQKEVDRLHKNNYLFGSRRMACFWPYESRAEGSDWDFAFPYEGSEYEERKKAETLGWVEKPTEKYKDNLHFLTWERMVGEHKVQMCSKINLRVFTDTFSSIEPSFYWTYLHKSSPDVLSKETQTAIFNQMYIMKGW